MIYFFIVQHIRSANMLDTENETIITNPSVKVKSVFETASPRARDVFLINDDFTPMEFVADVLKKVFKMDVKTSERITMKAHFDGKALCGTYPKDLAETMACAAMDLARKAGYPLLLVTAWVKK